MRFSPASRALLSAPSWYMARDLSCESLLQDTSDGAPRGVASRPGTRARSVGAARIRYTPLVVRGEIRQT